MKLKKYQLKIIYDPETGEIEHLSEFDDSENSSIGYTIDVQGIIYTVPDEMGEYLDKHTDSDILGLS